MKRILSLALGVLMLAGAVSATTCLKTGFMFDNTNATATVYFRDTNPAYSATAKVFNATHVTISLRYDATGPVSIKRMNNVLSSASYMDSTGALLLYPGETKTFGIDETRGFYFSKTAAADFLSWQADRCSNMSMTASFIPELPKYTRSYSAHTFVSIGNTEFYFRCPVNGYIKRIIYEDDTEDCTAGSYALFSTYFPYHAATPLNNRLFFIHHFHGQPDLQSFELNFPCSVGDSLHVTAGTLLGNCTLSATVIWESH